MGKRGSICAHDGCDRRLGVENTTGFCGRHKADQPEPAPAPRARPGVATVEVAYPTSNSGVPGKVRVSVPALPWEKVR